MYVSDQCRCGGTLCSCDEYCETAAVVTYTWFSVESSVDSPMTISFGVGEEFKIFYRRLMKYLTAGYLLELSSLYTANILAGHRRTTKIRKSFMKLKTFSNIRRGYTY